MRFEIRVPACNRPVMLRRALESLCAQTYRDWRAIVFDDSTSTASREATDAIGDPRICYRRNPTPRGAHGNIDQAFSPEPLAGGDYGCLLEDDNFWLPDFLAALVPHISETPLRVFLANQRINIEGDGLRPPTETTRGNWFSPGPVDPRDLRLTLMVMEGLSNGGLVWRLNAGIDLRIGAPAIVPFLNEACRSMLIGEPFLFLPQAHAVWTHLPLSQTVRATDKNRRINRGMQSLTAFLVRQHGRPFIEDALDLAARHAMPGRIGWDLAYSGFPALALMDRTLSAFDLAKGWAKGLAVRLTEADPCETFLASDRIPKL